jgi:plastocyanin
MKTKTQTGENQPAPCRPGRSLRPELYLSWLAAMLLATNLTTMAATVQVQVGGDGPVFTPSGVTIQPGDTVQWNWDYTPNGASVTSGISGRPNGLFDSGVHSAPYSFSHTFTSVGSFDYFCRMLPAQMTGSVGVVAPTTTLGNISTRLRVETGDNVLIGGFIVSGTQPKKVIVRAIGTSLPFADRLANPTLELHGPAGLIDANDNWVDSPNKQAIIDSNVPPNNDLESAIVATLPANNSAYTAIVRGVNNTTGIGVVEAYDLNTAVDSKLANISTRGFVQTGDNVLIAGTIVVGQTSQKVIVRGIGPSLPINGKLADPFLELHDSNGGTLETNDNWVDSANKQAIVDSGIPPTNDMESAIVRMLAPGTYTAIARGVNNATGIGLVEVYALP